MNRMTVRWCLILAACCAIAAPLAAAERPKMPKGWRVFTPRDNSFSAYAPQQGGREHDSQLILPIPNSNPIRLATLVYEPRVGCALEGAALEIPKVIAQQLAAKDWEEVIRDAYIEKGKRKLIDFKDGDLAGIAGKEYLVKLVKEEIFTRCRMITVGDQYLYLAAVFGSEAQVQSDEANTYFDSFRIPNRVAKLAPPRKDKPKVAEKPKEPVKKGESLDAATLDKLIKGLKSSEAKERQDAAERLAKAAPAERRDEVAKALAEQMADSNAFVLGAVSKALAVWGTKDNVPALIELLKHDNKVVRGRAMEVLAALKDERGAEAVAKRMEKTADRAKASQSLQDMGPVAEPAVAKRLKYPVAEVRLEACKVLKVIGSKASVPALEALSADSSAQVARAAQETASKLQGR